MGKAVIALDKIIETSQKQAEKKVIHFFAEIISDLENNKLVTEDDKAFLKKLSADIHIHNYVTFESPQYRNLKQMYEEYKKNRDSSEERYQTELLIRQLKILVSNYNILYNASLDNAVKNFEKKAENKIKNLDKAIGEKLIQSGEMLGNIADNSNAKKYLDYANQNRVAAKWLFWFSSSIMLSLAIFSAFALYFTDFETKDIFARFSMFLAILLPAFFMMREAKKLKDKEFQYHDIACRIITSGPYIDSLHIDVKEKDKLKADLVKDFFARPIECKDDGGLPPIENICEIIKTCLEKKP